MTVTTKTVSSGYSTGTINENFQTLEDYINNNLLNRDGTSTGEVNQMELSLDMNSNFIFNLPEPTLEHQAARLQDVQNALADNSANLITFTPYKHISSDNVQGALQELIDEAGEATVSTSTGDQSLVQALEQRGPVFDTVADLVASSSVTAGIRCRTLGYHSIGDGGGNDYEIVAASSGTADGGSYIDLSGSGLQAKALFGGIFHAEQFGAVGDGVNDDTAAFQAMFRYLQDIGGGTVFQLAKEYVFTDIIKIGKNLKWKSSLGTVYRRDHLGNMIANDLDVTSSTSGPDGGNGNILIEGGVFDGNSLGDYYDGFNAFEIGYARNVKFHGVTVLDVVNAHAVDLSACEEVWFNKCRFLGFSDSTGGTRDFSEAVQLDPNLPGTFNGGALDGTHCKKIYFLYCYVGKNPAHSDSRFDSWPAGIGSHVTAHDRFFEDIVVKGNIFDGCTNTGVGSFKWKSVSVVGNQFVNIPSTADCIQLFNVSNTFDSSNNPDGTPSGLPQGGESVVISGNVFDGGNDQIRIIGRVNDDGASGILYGVQKDVSICGNIFKNSSSNAIDITWADGVTISSNTFKDAARLVFALNAKSVNITGNTGEGFSSEGIYCESAGTDDVTDSVARASRFHSHWTISGNTVANCQLWGMFLLYLWNSKISSNNIVDPSQSSTSRGGIQLAAGGGDSMLDSNFVYYTPDATQADTGISATPSTSFVVMGANYAVGNTTDVANLSSGGLSLNADYT